MAESVPIERETTVKDRILENTEVIKVGKDGFPTIHKLNFNEHVIDRQFRLRKCSIGKPTMVDGCPAPEKIIMMVGATGAGKSTIINAFVNYYYGTEWKDSYRLKLITEEDEGINGVAQSQTKSQTKCITAYILHYQPGCRVSYTLVIIDTPGFGDVDGIKRDEEIINQIREFFIAGGSNGVDHLDAIGFVVQNSVNRLTHTQKYIFDSIFSIFGKNISSNIFSMITFADGQKPPALKAIEEANVPSRTHFKFNNSALYAANTSKDGDEDETVVDHGFWKIGFTSMEKFFKEFSNVESISLKLTKEVLDERKRLEALVQGIQPRINYGLGKLEELRQEIRIFEDHVNDIEKNESFTYQVTVTKQRKIDCEKGNFVTNCLKCNYTCHYPCGIPNDREKYRCAAMDSETVNSKCTACPDKCVWKSHVNNTYRFELYQDSENRTSDDMMKRYRQAKQDGTATYKVCQILQEEFKQTQEKVYEMISIAKKAITRLEEIALKPNPLSVIQYIELLITSEQQEAKPGWKQRIEHLNEAKEKAEIIEGVKSGNGEILFEAEGDYKYLDTKFQDLSDKAGTKSKPMRKSLWAYWGKT